MKRVIAGIGVVGSGKTTLLKPYALHNDYVYISPDDIRGEISGDVRIQSDMKLVWETAFARMRTALFAGKTVIFDATQYKAEDRKTFTSIAQEAGAEEIIGVFVDVPLEVARERNQSRERVVPDHALLRMHRALQKTPPTVEEGFTRIVSPDWLTS